MPPQKHFEIRILNCFIFDIKVKHTQKKFSSQCSHPDPQTLVALPSTHAELTLIECRHCQERILCTLDNVALISPAEVAVLESMMEGGRELSLKAHFLPHLPDLASLSTTLTHLNVSFNDLRVGDLSTL